MIQPVLFSPAGGDNPLEGFQLGPSWAREKSSDAPKKSFRDREEEGPRDRDRRGRREDGGRFEGRGLQGGQGRREFREFRDDRRPQRRELPDPEQGVRAELHPSRKAAHLVAQEIHHVARVYALYDVAQLVLADRARFVVKFLVSPNHAPVFGGKKDTSLWLTKEEALAHFWASPWKTDFIEEETVEVEPPAGNFQSVARCGFSGVLLGPPNFHGYQSELRRVHREQFSHVPFEVYSSKVRNDRSEEALNEWRDSMKTQTRFRLKDAGDDDWTTDRAEIERKFLAQGFAAAYSESREVEIAGDVSAKSISPGLLAVLKIAGSHARKHPAMIIPALCKDLEQEHLPIFKRQGKLFTGPARPHPLPEGTVLADRPSAIYQWLKDKPNAKLEQLWKEILPEGQSEPSEEWLADLFWLLTQGHVLLFSDGTFVVPERRANQPQQAAAVAAPAKKKAKKPRKRRERKPLSSIKLRRKVERMNPRRLKLARGGERVWRHRLRMRVLRHMQPEEEEN